MRAASLLGAQMSSDPRNRELYLSRAEVYRALNRYDDALDDYRRALVLGAEKRRIALELDTLEIERALRGSPPLALPADIR